MSTCRVELDNGPVLVNLTAEWDPYPAGITTFAGYTTFLGRDKASHASLYWGESLLANHRVHLNNEMNAVDDHRSKDEITFTVRDSGDDITNLSFFNISSRSIILHVEEDGSSFASIGMVDDDWTVGSLVDEGHTLWLAADNLAKSFISVILTDLGQTTAKQNILQDPLLLQHFTSNFPEILKGADIRGAGPILEDYEAQKDTTGPLAVTSATLAVNYLCNVPQRKPWSELIVSILIADLVFMRALWCVFTLTMSDWVKSKEKTRNWCEECSSRENLPIGDMNAEAPVATDSPDDGDRSLGIPLLRLGSKASSQDSQHR